MHVATYLHMYMYLCFYLHKGYQSITVSDDLSSTATTVTTSVSSPSATDSTAITSMYGTAQFKLYTRVRIHTCTYTFYVSKNL